MWPSVTPRKAGSRAGTKSSLPFSRISSHTPCLLQPPGAGSDEGGWYSHDALRPSTGHSSGVPSLGLSSFACRGEWPTHLAPLLQKTELRSREGSSGGTVGDHRRYEAHPERCGSCPRTVFPGLHLSICPVGSSHSLQMVICIMWGQQGRRANSSTHLWLPSATPQPCPRPLLQMSHSTRREAQALLECIFQALPAPPLSIPHPKRTNTLLKFLPLGGLCAPLWPMSS